MPSYAPSAIGDAIFHGEFSSADASALTEPNSRIILYPAGTTTAYTLASTDQVIVTGLTVVSTGAVTVTVYDGADNVVDAGERIAKQSFAANGSESRQFSVPHFCQVGTWPKVKASGAGQVDVTLYGFIRKGGGGA